MLDLQFIRTHTDELRENIRRRRMAVDLDLFLELDSKRRELIGEVDELRAERNQLSEQIPSLASGERESAIAKVRGIKEQLVGLEQSLGEVEAQHREVWEQIPNQLSPAVPQGASDEDNVEVSRHGQIRQEPWFKDHVQLSEALDVVDFDRAAQVSGSKFYFLKRDLVKLELALKQFALDELIADGFVPIKSPVLARQEILNGTGYNPRGEETQIYSVENSDLSLIATSEITIAGYLADAILEDAELPIRFAGISECYRTEAGNYGRFSKGLYRVHHFDKVEMFVFCRPEDSEAEHQAMLAREERIFQKLEIPYRVVDICDGDLGGVAYRKYDVEAWMPGRGESGDFGEVTSCSNCTDYQARRLNIRYRDEQGNPQFVHTLNGTALATSSRAMIALLENHQQEDGSIRIPEVLVPYMGGKTQIVAPQ